MERRDELLAAFRSVFTETANVVARETGVIQRQRQFSGAILLQTLILGWLEQPDATLTQLCQLAAVRGAVVTPQALDQRFTPALVTCLERFLAIAVGRVADGAGGEPVAIPLLHRFSGIWLLDSTTISLPQDWAERWPGCGGRRRSKSRSSSICCGAASPPSNSVPAECRIAPPPGSTPSSLLGVCG